MKLIPKIDLIMTSPLWKVIIEADSNETIKM